MMTAILVSVGAVLLVGFGVIMARRVATTQQRARRILIEDALKHLYHSEDRGTPSTIESLAGIIGATPDAVTDIVTQLTDDRLIIVDGSSLRLTGEGRARALRTIRSHRLWERYLADETGVREEQWHAEADKREHGLSTGEVEALARKLGHPLVDPHGDPIPAADGSMPVIRGTSLQRAEPGKEYTIVHLEDEPAVVYKDLLDAQLFPGANVRVLNRTDRGVRVSRGERVQDLSLIAAANVTVVPFRGVRKESALTLDKVRVGHRARVVGISDQCRGVQRRRLLDLGIVPGSVIGAELVSTAGDPVAYRIRGSLVALRRTQAALINVEPVGGRS